MKSLKFITSVLLLLSFNAYADIGTDYKDLNVSMDSLADNALKQTDPKLTYEEIIAQLQKNGATSDSIEDVSVAFIHLALRCNDDDKTEIINDNKADDNKADIVDDDKVDIVDDDLHDGCRNLSPSLISDILNAGYGGLEALKADQPAYDKLTVAVYNAVPADAKDILVAIGEAALSNPNVDPTLATAPTAAGGSGNVALTAPAPPPPASGSGGGGAASPN